MSDDSELLALSPAYAPRVQACGRFLQLPRSLTKKVGQTKGRLPTQYYRFVQVIAGSVRILQEQVTVAAGQVLLLQPDDSLDLRCAAGTELHHLLFTVTDPACIPQPQAQLVWGQAIPRVVPADQLAVFGDRWADIAASYWLGGLQLFRSHQLLGLMVMDLVLADAADPLAAALSSLQDLPQPGHDDPIQRSIRFAEWRLRQGRCPHVEAMAGQAGLSVEQFHRRFRQAMTLSPGQWLRRQRLALARVLLSQSSMSIAGVAQHCGWRSPASFSRAFADVLGMTPSAWRESRPAAII